MPGPQEGRIVTAQVSPGKLVLTPYGFHQYAADYLKAAQCLPPQENFSPVPYYLYCRSVELSLKAFLLARGVTIAKLRTRISHYLNKALRKAEARCLSEILSITEAQRREIKKANAYYAEKEFEYFEVYRALKGYPERPDLDALKDVAHTLVEKLEAVCRQTR